MAAGQRFMKLQPVNAGSPGFEEALQTVDAPGLRSELYASILGDVCKRADIISEGAQVSLVDDIKRSREESW